MAQGSRWKTWLEGIAVGLVAWALWTGITWFVVVSSSSPSSRAWLDYAGWQVWLGVPCGAYWLWRMSRGARAGFLALGLLTGLALPLVVLIVGLLITGVPHA